MEHLLGKKYSFFNNTDVLYWFCIGFFVANFLGQIAIILEIVPKLRYTAVVNIIFELYLVICFCINKKLKQIITPFVLLIFFLIGQSFLTRKIDFYVNFNQFKTDSYIYIVNNYLFLFLFYSVLEALQQKKELSKKVYSFFLLLFNINSFFIFLGWILKVDFLKSYGGDRFGYIGLLGHDTLIFYMYCLLILFIYNEYIKSSSKVVLINFIYLCFTSALIGKKGIFLFFFLLAFYHFFFYLKKIRVYAFLSLVPLIMLVFFMREKIESFILEMFPFWIPFAKDKGWITIAFSTRDLSFVNFIEYISNNWYTVNYFLGGVKFPEFWVEMSLVDLFSTFGLLGVGVFVLWFYLKMRKIPLKQCLLISIVLLVSLFCGNFFINVNLLVFLVYLMLLWSENEKAIDLKVRGV